MDSASTTKGTTSSPSTEQARKRRHNTAPGSDPANSPPTKRVKRAQTTYGKSRTIADEDHDEVPSSRLRTSQSAHYSEHSHAGDPRSSAEVGLPGGSIGEDFANHEPAVLFRDTGSTIEDSSSAQKRYWEQARMSETRVSSSNVRLDLPAPSQSDLKSSSLAWWPASERTPRATGQANGQQANGHASISGKEDIVGHDGEELNATLLPASHRSTQKIGSIEHSHPEHDHVLQFSLSAQDIGLKAHASPIVEIPLLDNTSAVTSAAIGSTQKPFKGRRRKSEIDHVHSEPLNSDDKVIGLPKEQYVPRPTRRRATAVIEEPIDYSIIPEKAAKVKRTKTSSTAASGRTLPSQQRARSGETDKLASANNNPDHNSIEAKSPHQTKSDHENDNQLERNGSRSTQTEHDPQPAKSSQDMSSSIAVKPKEDSEVFAKPDMPPPSVKTSRSRRSHTTIFEDHVEFAGSQRSSPSLSQQQAKRKSALQFSKDGPPSATQRSRRHVVLDDEDVEDDVDELAKEIKEDPPPQKRGRGRPAKSTATAKVKSKETVLEDPEDNEGEVSATEEPKKSKRGRPVKAKATADTTAASSDKENLRSTTDKSAEHVDDVDGTNPSKDSSQIPQNPKSASTHDIPTPSPEKPVEKRTEKTDSTPQIVFKPDPASHSPIKSSSSVPYRVGLSKKHRIPSLLRTMRPPKQ